MWPRQTVQRRRSPPAKEQQMQLGRKHKPDYWLLIWCSVLLAIGLIVVYSISPALAQTYNVSDSYYVVKQLIAIGLSLVAFAVTSQVPLSWWRQAYKPLMVIATLATILALVMSVNPSYPAHRWVRLGGFSFQSVELVKFAGLIWLGGFLANKIASGDVKSTKKTLQPILFALFAIGFIIAGVQSDLGSAGVIVVMVGTMAFVAGIPLKRITLLACVILFGLVLLVSSTPYRRARLETYLHPQSNCSGSGYQACQALIAVGSGGTAGLGLGSSVQAYGYLPEAANDSIFAIYAEKFGFIGSIILLGVFVAFLTRLKTIAERTSDDFTRLVIMGILAWLSVQTLINIGAMIGILPLKGITLPFISYGGTSVVFATAAVGLAFQASQYTSYTTPSTDIDKKGKTADRNFRDNTLRRASY
jgi:cell division protein FtsW